MQGHGRPKVQAGLANKRPLAPSAPSASDTERCGPGLRSPPKRASLLTEASRPCFKGGDPGTRFVSGAHLVRASFTAFNEQDFARQHGGPAEAEDGERSGGVVAGGKGDDAGHREEDTHAQRQQVVTAHRVSPLERTAPSTTNTRRFGTSHEGDGRDQSDDEPDGVHVPDSAGTEPARHDAAHDRPHDTEEDGEQDADLLASWEQKSRERTDDEAHKDEVNDRHRKESTPSLG